MYKRYIQKFKKFNDRLRRNIQIRRELSKNAGRKPKTITGDIVILRENVCTRLHNPNASPHHILVSIVLTDKSFCIYHCGNPIVCLCIDDYIWANLNAGKTGGSFQKFPKTEFLYFYHQGSIQSFSIDYIQNYLKEIDDESKAMLYSSLSNIYKKDKVPALYKNYIEKYLEKKKENRNILDEQKKIMDLGMRSSVPIEAHFYSKGKNIDIHCIKATDVDKNNFVYDLDTYHDFTKKYKYSFRISIEQDGMLLSIWSNIKHQQYYIEDENPEILLQSINSFVKWTIISIEQIIPGPSMCPI